MGGRLERMAVTTRGDTDGETVRRKRVLAVLLLCSLTGCDLGETVELRRPDLSPVLCPVAERTRFTATFLTRGSTEPDQYSSVVEPKGGALSTRPPYPAVGILAGSVESGRLEWIQFQIFCGDATKPYLVTPTITPRDLVKAGERTFRYIVDDPNWKKAG